MMSTDKIRDSGEGDSLGVCSSHVGGCFLDICEECGEEIFPSWTALRQMFEQAANYPASQAHVEASTKAIE